MSDSRCLSIVVIALALWLGSGAVADAQPPIRIGASASRTGTYVALGQNQLRGYQLCVKHMNARGGVLGRKLELVLHDDVSDPATAVSLYEKLITQDKVDLVLGPYSSPISDAVALDREKIRDAILKLDVNTVFGPFKVDGDGLQVAHTRVMFQWQTARR